MSERETPSTTLETRDEEEFHGMREAEPEEEAPLNEKNLLKPDLPEEEPTDREQTISQDEEDVPKIKMIELTLLKDDSEDPDQP